MVPSTIGATTSSSCVPTGQQGVVQAEPPDVRILVADAQSEHGDEVGDDGVAVAGDEGDLAESQHRRQRPSKRAGRFSMKALNASRQSADDEISAVPCGLHGDELGEPHALGGDVVGLQATPGERRGGRQAIGPGAHLVEEHVVVEHRVDEPDRGGLVGRQLARQQRQLAGGAGADQAGQRPRQAHVAGDGHVEERRVEPGRRAT